MKLTITSHAEKQIKRLPKATQIIFTVKIRKLLTESFIGLEKLSGKGNFYKSRIGSYRIILAKYKDEIEIVLIAHRKEVYNLLERLRK